MSGTKPGSGMVRHVHEYRKAFTTHLFEFGTIVLVGVGGMYMIRYLLNNMDPTKDKKKKRIVHPEVLNRLRNNGWGTEMGEYEAIMLEHITFPKQIDVTLNDIGGCQPVKEAIEEIFTIPLQNPEIFEGSKLLSPPKGMLFFGAPGTGKTMMAKAICKSSGSTFFNIRASDIQSKWFGDSVRLIRGLFKLAHKLAPSVIFIDEMDAFLHERGRGRDHEATLAMKAEFMSLWDGLIENPSSKVIVLGATNRPEDIDKAILRRLPRKFEFKMPDMKARMQILKNMLKGNQLDTKGEYDSRGVTIEKVAELTERYSGSDLLEMCKACAMIPLKEYIRAKLDKKETPKKTKLRPLTLTDFIKSMQKVKPTGQTARTYARQRQAEEFAASMNNGDEDPYDGFNT
eukprot:jgi/Bigna1/85171/estExt_fgenesh1_pg.C_20359